MSTFGRISNNVVTDVCFGSDVKNATGAAFVAEYIAKVGGTNAWTVLPDGTAPNATTNDGGKTFSPPANSQIAVPKVMTKTEFRAYAVSKLGTGLTGMARFQDIMDAAEAATGFVKFCFTQYHDATDILRDDLAGFLDIMVSAKIVTQPEHDAVIGGWPTE